MPPAPPARFGWVRRAVRLVALAAGALAVVLALAYAYARHRLNQAEAAWARDAEPMPVFAARFPAQPDSPAALKLDELTRPLGILIVRKPADDDRANRADTNREPRNAIVRFVSERGRSATDALVNPPDAAVAFLEQEKARLDAIEEHILHGGPLASAQDISKGVAAPIPSLIGLRHLQNVLLTRAWVAARDRRPRDAERALEAASLLDAPLADRPELVTLFISMAMRTFQHSVLRAVRVAPDTWLPRLRERAFSDRIHTAYQFEAWLWSRYASGGWGFFDVIAIERAEERPSSRLAALGRVATAPYFHLSLADTSERLLLASRPLRAQKRCDFDIGQYQKELDASLPRWNVIGRIGTPSLLRSWIEMRRADFDRELTERVLEARAARAATGRWPESPTPSTVCEAISWLAEPSPDGSTTLRPSPRPFRPGISPWDWRFTLTP